MTAALAEKHRAQRIDEAGRLVHPNPCGGHGGAGTGYAHCGCRCAACTAANTARCRRANRDAYHRRKAERVVIDGRLVHPNPHGGHGTHSAYTGTACRCVPCCEAAATYVRGDE